MARSPAPNRNGLTPCTGSTRNASPGIASVEKPDETEMDDENASGNERVVMSTRPPEKLPGLSGVKVFSVTMFSRKPAGKRSNWTARRSGSAVGRTAPLSCVLA